MIMSFRTTMSNLSAGLIPNGILAPRGITIWFLLDTFASYILIASFTIICFVKRRVKRIWRQVALICGRKVMLDINLAKRYQVSTKVFNQAAKRNPDRFPEDFMFQPKKTRTPIVTPDFHAMRVLLFVTFVRKEHKSV
jgi:hypothetical protein